MKVGFRATGVVAKYDPKRRGKCGNMIYTREVTSVQIAPGVDGRSRSSRVPREREESPGSPLVARESAKMPVGDIQGAAK